MLDLQKRSKTALTASAIMLSLALLCGILYRENIQALVWHVTHKGEIRTKTYTMKLPLSWWEKEHNAVRVSSSLLRATISQSGEAPQDVPQTDEEARQQVQRFIDVFNSKLNNHYALVRLESGSMKIFCAKDIYYPGLGMLTCYSARIPYSFNYLGPAEYEPEAESVLSSLQPAS